MGNMWYHATMEALLLLEVLVVKKVQQMQVCCPLSLTIRQKYQLGHSLQLNIVIHQPGVTTVYSTSGTVMCTHWHLSRASFARHAIILSLHLIRIQDQGWKHFIRIPIRALVVAYDSMKGCDNVNKRRFMSRKFLSFLIVKNTDQYTL